MEHRTDISGIASDFLKGRVYEVSLGDLNKSEMDFRKFRLICEDVKGRNCLTNFHGMTFTRDKICSIIKKWHTLIEANTTVKTTDGYYLRLFVIGFTKRSPNQVKKTTYAQGSKVRQIRAKMVEIMKKEVRVFWRAVCMCVRSLSIGLRSGSARGRQQAHSGLDRQGHREGVLALLSALRRLHSQGQSREEAALRSWQAAGAPRRDGREQRRRWRQLEQRQKGQSRHVRAANSRERLSAFSRCRCRMAPIARARYTRWIVNRLYFI